MAMDDLDDLFDADCDDTLADRLGDDDDCDDDDCDFADPGGNSALRAASASNPRNLACPTCGRQNVLTPADVRHGYQCNACADAEEGCGGYES